MEILVLMVDSMESLVRWVVQDGLWDILVQVDRKEIRVIQVVLAGWRALQERIVDLMAFRMGIPVSPAGLTETQVY